MALVAVHYIRITYQNVLVELPFFSHEKRPKMFLDHSGTFILWVRKNRVNVQIVL